MKETIHIIDLDLPVDKRWSFLADYKEEVDELIECYLKDFEGEELLFEGLDLVKDDIVPQEFLEEIKFISSISRFSENEILFANLYYDILKSYFGCSAFAFHTHGVMHHARNLDWHTDNNLLSKHSAIYRFFKGGKELYRTVGWHGFIGALSGSKPGKFSVTLNAVLSKDQPEIGIPVSFLIRQVLNDCQTFSEAKELLESAKIASDCLLLLSGCDKSEMVVIERTPNRFASRVTANNFIAVTNDYKLLDNNLAVTSNILSDTSCGRYNRVIELLSNKHNSSIEECLQILSDDKIKMGITVQQMAFQNQTGKLLLRKTDSNTIYQLE